MATLPFVDNIYKNAVTPNQSIDPNAGKPISNPFSELIKNPYKNQSIDPNAGLNLGSTPIDLSKAPAIDNSGAVSDIQTHSDATTAKLKEIQDQLAIFQTQKTDSSKSSTPDQTTQSSFIDKLNSFLGKNKNDLSTAQGTQVPTLEDATNKYLAGLGFTPESIRQTSDLNNQLTSVNKQIASLETARQTELSRIETTAGGTIGQYGAEETRINREYAIRESGLGAQGSALSAQIGILTGAYDKAQEAAQNYVTFKTAEKRQAVQDIQWAMSFYSTLFTSLDKSEQDKINTQFNQNLESLKFEQTKAQDEVQNKLKQTELSISQQNANTNAFSASTERAKVLATYTAQPGEPVNPQTGVKLPVLPEVKNNDLDNAIKLIKDANNMIDLINTNGNGVVIRANPIGGGSDITTPFDTQANKFKASYSAIYHTYASQISTQLLRSPDNQKSIRQLLPKITGTKESNIYNLKNLISAASDLVKSIDPTGGYRSNMDTGYYGIKPSEIRYSSSNIGNSGASFSINAPDGKTYSFKSQSDLDAFKKAADL